VYLAEDAPSKLVAIHKLDIVQGTEILVAEANVVSSIAERSCRTIVSIVAPRHFRSFGYSLACSQVA
jgi:hypothetical protein